MQRQPITDEWERTFDAVPDLIMILDQRHRIVRANKSIGEKLGRDAKDLSGLPCYEAVHGTNAPPEWCPHVRLLSDGMEHHIEKVMEYLGGEYFVSVSPLLDAQGKPCGCVHVARDITALKKSEKELKKAHDELDRRVRDRTMALTKARERLKQETRELTKSQSALAERVKFERFLADLSANFAAMPTERIAEEIQKGLKLIVKFLKIDRISFLEFFDDQSLLKVAYSYAEPGFEPVASMVVDGRFPWGLSKLQRKEIVKFNTLDELPPEAGIDRKSFEKLGLKSHLSIPIVLADAVSCIISFGSLEKEISWPETLIPRLKLFGEILANAVSRKNAEERRREDEQKLHQAISELTALKGQLETESEYLQEEIKLEKDFENIVGQSKALRYIFFRIEQVAKTEAPVLLMGETGTGKELVARPIHKLSARSARPLIKVNCAPCLPGSLKASFSVMKKGLLPVRRHPDRTL